MIGGLGSLVGAVWGAALLVLLPNWTTDLANSFSLSTNVSHNLPIAIYGVVLIGGDAGVADRDPGRRAGGRSHACGRRSWSRRAGGGQPGVGEAEAEAGSDEGVKASQP